MDLLTGDDFLGLFENYREAFRAEFLHNYLVVSDNTADGVSDFERWLAGAEAPDPERKAGLLQDLRDELADGRRLYRVKAMSRTPYDLYSAEWGYAYNIQAGEEVYIWDVLERALPDATFGFPDFWLIDDRVVVMHYNLIDGEFLGASIAPHSDLPRYRAARDALLAEAVPFDTWWAAHPELHRQAQAA
jgi:hypothetical protein